MYKDANHIIIKMHEIKILFFVQNYLTFSAATEVVAMITAARDSNSFMVMFLSIVVDSSSSEIMAITY